jgi:hypothetical protein
MADSKAEILQGTLDLRVRTCGVIGRRLLLDRAR